MERDPAIETFLSLLQINSPSGDEGEIEQYLVGRLRDLGLDVRLDGVGNVIARAEGTGEPLLLSAHMDTVEPTAGLCIVERDGVICTDGSTILGADDKAGVTVVLEALRRAKRRPPLDIVFSVREETGLIGAKSLDLASLRARRGMVFDSGGAIGTVVTQAPSQYKIAATVHGRAAHAGAAPEKGINAIVVAAQAITRMRLGRIDPETTANVGVIHGGQATNIVPECVTLRGEARSHSEESLQAQLSHMRWALESAAAEAGGKVEVEVERSYSRFHIPDSHPLVQAIHEVAEAMGFQPKTVSGGGGSDANIFNAGGIECVNVSVGMEESHAKNEFIRAQDLVDAAKLVTCILERLAG